MLILLPLVAACGPTPPSAAVAPEVLEAEVRAFLVDYADALTMREPDAIRALYAPDVHWVERGNVAYTSADAIVASLERLDPPLRNHMEPVVVRLVGDDGALVIATFESEFARFSFSGLVTMTLERHGVDWRVVGGATAVSEAAVDVAAPEFPSPSPSPEKRRLTVLADGTIELDDRRVPPDEQGAFFESLHEAHPDVVVLVVSEATLPPGTLVAVLDRAKAAGILRFAVDVVQE